MFERGVYEPDKYIKKAKGREVKNSSGMFTGVTFFHYSLPRLCLVQYVFITDPRPRTEASGPGTSEFDLRRV